jgi:VWFA-related protein
MRFRGPSTYLALVTAIAILPALSAQETPFTESISVRVVNVDVIATGKDGLFVPDMRREDFELLEDGKPIDIAYFALYGAGPLAAPGETPATAQEPAPLPPPPATYAVLVDQTQMRAGERNALLDQVGEFLTRSLRPEDKVLVATYSGRLKIITPLTADRRELEHGLAEIRRSDPVLSPTALRESILLRDIASADGGASVSAAENRDRMQYEIENLAEQEGRENLEAVRMTSTFVDAVSAFEGRKALLYVGAGVSSQPAGRLIAAFTQRFGVSGQSLTQLQATNSQQVRIEQARRAMVERAGAGRVTFYVVSAGPDRGPAMAGADEAGAIGANITAGPSGIVEPERESALAWLGRGTGGRVWVAQPHLASQLEGMTLDFAQYYSLGFAAHDQGVAHKLEVRSKRPGVTVRGRAAYRAPVPGEASGDAVAALLLGRSENPLEALLEWGEARQEKRGAPLLVPMTVRVPIRSLSFVNDGTQRLAKVAVDFAAKSTDGGVWTMERREFPIAVSNKKLVEALKQSAAFEFKLQLPKGNYRVLVAVRDQVSQAISTVTADLAVAREK